MAILLWRKTDLAQRLRARLSNYERLDEEWTPIFRQPVRTNPIVNEASSEARLNQSAQMNRSFATIRAEALRGRLTTNPNQDQFESVPQNPPPQPTAPIDETVV